MKCFKIIFLPLFLDWFHGFLTFSFFSFLYLSFSFSIYLTFLLLFSFFLSSLSLHFISLSPSLSMFYSVFLPASFSDVNFINILLAAFACVNSKSVKDTCSLTEFLWFWEIHMLKLRINLSVKSTLDLWLSISVSFSPA